MKSAGDLDGLDTIEEVVEDVVLDYSSNFIRRLLKFLFGCFSKRKKD
jgi:tetrahydromethanopterin S-methyltransferase subunit F